MFKVMTWDKRAQEFVITHSGTRTACEDWIKTRKLIGDRATYILRAWL